MVKVAVSLLALLASSCSGIHHSLNIRSAADSRHSSHLARQAGLNTKPPIFPESFHAGNGLKRRQERVTYNATTICNPALATSRFEDLKCINEVDCINWLQYHGKVPIFETPNPHSEALSDSYSKLADCVKHQCVLMEPLPEGAACNNQKDL
jgi:hypothetical protein